MEKFNSVELLYRSIRSMAVEGESTVLGTAHAPNRSIRSNRPNSFKWKLGLNDGIEDTEHFLLLCPSFDIQRRDLLAEISQLLQPFVQINNLSNIVLIKLLLYSDKDFSDSINKSILQLTINFIHKTGRFG